MNDQFFIPVTGLVAEHAGDGIQRTILAYDENTMLVKVEFDEGSIGAVHQHLHTQISYIEQGVFEVEINNQKQILPAGSSFYVPSNIPHGVLCVEKGILIDVFSPMRADFIP